LFNADREVEVLEVWVREVYMLLNEFVTSTWKAGNLVEETQQFFVS
jgi:hypothetical protein